MLLHSSFKRPYAVRLYLCAIARIRKSTGSNKSKLMVMQGVGKDIRGENEGIDFLSGGHENALLLDHGDYTVTLLKTRN